MSEVKFSTECPPIFEKIKKLFPSSKWEKMIITYGDTIYSKYPYPEDVKVHELVHIEQQKGIDKDIWCDKYLTDKKFRLKVEVEAYKVQAKWIQENLPRNLKRIRLKQITEDLSGAIYGNIISFLEAKKLIG